MGDLTAEIARAEKIEIEGILKAVLQRYEELFPDWEVNVLTLSKRSDKEEQLDAVITLLQKMKNAS